MEQYIRQLIEDIRAASWRIRPPREIWEGSDPDNEIENEDLSYVEEFIYGEEEEISSITGIWINWLPPVEKLTTEQARLLAVELEGLLNVFHFYPDFPPEFPVHLRYPFLVEIWGRKYVPLSFGESHIEFCDYDKNECPFPGYCKTCDEIAAQFEYDERKRDEKPGDNINMPF